MPIIIDGTVYHWKKTRVDFCDICTEMISVKDIC